MKMVFCSGHVDALGSGLGDRRFTVVGADVQADRLVLKRLRGFITDDRIGTVVVRGTPLVGTPTAEPHGGNSTPMAAPVAGPQESPVIGPDTGK